MSTILTVVSGLIEKVRQSGDLPKMYENAPNTLWGIIGENTEVETNVNRKFYRIPFETLRAGNFGKFSMNFGELGTGNSFLLNNFTAAYFAYSQAHKLDLELMKIAQGEGSVVNAFTRNMSQAIETAQAHMDVCLHTKGDGVLTEASSALSTLTFTFAGASDKLGVNRLMEGMTVQIWDTTLATKRGDARILAIDWEAKTATIDANPGGAVSTDRFVIRGSDAYGPSTPTTHSSTFPAGGSAAGIGGDSFIHGLDYYLDTTDANYVLGVQKSAVPQIQPVHVPASTSALTYLHGLLLNLKMQKRRGQDMLNEMTVIFPLSQRLQLASTNMIEATYNVSGGQFGQMMDKAPSQQGYQDAFQWAGMQGRVSKRMYEDRVHAIRPKLWGKVQPMKLDYHGEDGKYLFETRASSGAVTAGYEFFLVGACDTYCLDPGGQGVVDGLAVPSEAF